MSEMLTPLSDSRHTKAEGKFTPQICRSRIFVPANECTRVVPMYPSQSAMSHLHSLAQSMYIATFLPKHVIPTCFADYVTSTSGAIRLAFDLSPWPQVLGRPGLIIDRSIQTPPHPPTRKVASEGINHHVEHCIFVPASRVLFSSRCPTFRVSLLSSGNKR